VFHWSFNRNLGAISQQFLNPFPTRFQPVSNPFPTRFQLISELFLVKLISAGRFRAVSVHFGSNVGGCAKVGRSETRVEFKVVQEAAGCSGMTSGRHEARILKKHIRTNKHPNN